MSRMRVLLRLVVVLISLVAFMLTGLAQRRNSDELLAPHSPMDERVAAAAGSRQLVPVPSLPFDPLQRLQAPGTSTPQSGTFFGSPTAANLAAGSSLDASAIFLEAPTYDSGGHDAYSVALADVNGDGKPDLLVANLCGDSTSTCAGTVAVLFGNGDGTFQPAASYGSGGESAYLVAVADVNGDGKPDLLVANAFASNSNTNGTVGVLLGKGDGTFQPAVAYGSGGVGAQSVAVADVNGDG